MPRDVPSRLVWLLLTVPALLLAGRAVVPDADADLLTAESGEWAARLLVAVLAVTPLRRVVPTARWTAWLAGQRRVLGVAAFAYSLIHLGFYIAAMGALAPILAEALAASMLAGWLAFVLLLPLALTSNAAGVRRLGARWRPLHRLAYPAAGLALLHWLLVHDGATAAWLTVSPLIALQLLRLAGVSIRPSRSIR